MAQKEFKVGNFAKLFNYNVFFGDYLQYISWAVKFSKTVDTLIFMETKRFFSYFAKSDRDKPSKSNIFDIQSQFSMSKLC